ncbi:HIT domain-containing protein [Kribbella sp. NPDC056345]|uniref:HIT domain-containing protein n=1 Tax=Kribbella sp. NPDC056345 TaxID=3345789 RepID=UPI0035DF6529
MTFQWPAAGYWLETMRVARALMVYYRPLKMNYETLGNTSPHLHTHLLPRYVEDPRPGHPFPLLAQQGNQQQISEERFLTEVDGLREILAERRRPEVEVFLDAEGNGGQR